MIQTYLIGAVLFAIISGGGWIWIEKLQSDKAALEAQGEVMKQAYTIAAQTAIENKKTLDDERKERQRVDDLLADRERKRKELENANARLNEELNNLKANNAEVRAWMDAPVPGAVLELLNAPAAAPAAAEGGSAEAVPAGKPDAGNAPAGGLHPH